MRKLENELTFEATLRPELKFVIDDDPAKDSATMELKGTLNRTIASELGIDWVFVTETVAHSGLRDGNLLKDITYSNVELVLQGGEGILHVYPEKLYSWRIFSAGGGGWGIQCKVDKSGPGDDVLEFFRLHRGQDFQWTIRPRQQNLFESEDGTRVEMNAAPVQEDLPMEAVGDSDQIACPHCGGKEQHSDECIVLSIFREDEPAVDVDRSYENTAKKRGRKPKEVAVEV